MKQPFDWTKAAIYGAGGLVSVILGVALSIAIYSADNPAPGRAVPLGVSGEAAIGGPFQLVDKNGNLRDEKILRGEVSLVYFGFTRCPNFCPLELDNLVAAKKELAGSGITPQIVFVSVDPERDTPSALKNYVDYFDPAIIGLTGPVEQVRLMASRYRIHFEKRADPNTPGDYVVDHTTLVFAFGPDGKYMTHFEAMTTPKEIATKLRALTRKAGSS